MNIFSSLRQSFKTIICVCALFFLSESTFAQQKALGFGIQEILKFG